jgi:hypothetical protein
MDIGDLRFFCKYHQIQVTSTPEIAPKISGFHDTALDGIGHNIVDFIEFTRKDWTSLNDIKLTYGSEGLESNCK